ncbi:GNAT family N-acetyltransferase [Rickettsiales endosymbiont of Stachyamoeba lipophora]|uniref:GNAT family N-acetyltransferase n=1 Tax=Rickettsiales endosymbiont of Stachyamoeba lipophora TaxID=2486578 RepID=UPI0019D25E4E
MGRKLFAELEQYAKSKNCKYIQLDTFEFQAKPFYEKLGFKCIGTIKEWIKGYDWHFMRKVL